MSSRPNHIPQPFIDELINKADIVEIVETRVALKPSTRNDYKGLCPFHQEKSPSFTVSAAKQFYYCFGCQASGNAISFLMEYDRLSFVEAVEYLAKDQGVSLPTTYTPQVREKASPDYYALMTHVMRFYRQQLKHHAAGPQAIAYLKERGLTGEICQRYGVGFAPNEWDALLKHFGPAQTKALQDTGMLIEKSTDRHYDRFRGRIMFPIRDKRGRVIGFGGRVLDQGEPKYLNSPETVLFHKGSELYGLHEVFEVERQPKYLLVVEGYMDVVALAQHQIHPVVATLGTAVTEKHLSRLFRLVKTVVLCFDGDRAGQQAAWRALETSLPLLSDDLSLKFIFLPEGEDPDSYVRKKGTQGFTQAIEDATPFSKFFIKHCLAHVDTSYVDGQARLVSFSAPLLAKLPNGVLRDMLIDKLAQYTRLDRPRMLQAIFPEQSPVVNVSTPVKPQAAVSPVDHAISLLLQQGSLAAQVGDVAQLSRLSYPRCQLLIDIIGLLKSQPTLNTGAVLAHWPDAGTQSALASLAARPFLLSEPEALANEFMALINKLQQEVADQALSQLLAKARQGDLSGLSAQEKVQLQQILSKSEEGEKKSHSE